MERVQRQTGPSISLLGQKSLAASEMAVQAYLAMTSSTFRVQCKLVPVIQDVVKPFAMSDVFAFHSSNGLQSLASASAYMT